MENSDNKIYKTVKVLSSSLAASPDIYLLKVRFSVKDNALCFSAGQFFMLKAPGTSCLLPRPISIYGSEKKDDYYILSFLIMDKGEGTHAIIKLKEEDDINIMGPLGNSFSAFYKKEKLQNKKVCLVGGGIGVAPIAYFAKEIQNASYDFYASFKDTSYGIDKIKPNKLLITTESGREGVKGILSDILTSEEIKTNKYEAIFACGPYGMLKHLKEIAKEAGVKCYLSMERKMACGAGACLGCSIKVKEGFLRCCKDGPVFDADILDCFDDLPIKKVKPLENVHLTVAINGIEFKNPLIAASGTFGYGDSYSTIFYPGILGGLVSKGLTLNSCKGNDGVRLWECEGGLLNSIGLQNPGIKEFVKTILPNMLKIDAVSIVNLCGFSLEDYTEGAKLLDKTLVPLIELNLSCPNVKSGGASFGSSCIGVKTVINAVKKCTDKPLIVKLSPMISDIRSVALTCIEEGAVAITLSNSFIGMAIDINKCSPVFNNIVAGYSGPAIKPLNLRIVYETAKAINMLPPNKRVPIIACGGVKDYKDVIEYIMAGALLVEVGEATFTSPLTLPNCIKGLEEFMKKRGFPSIESMRGIAHKDN